MTNGKIMLFLNNFKFIPKSLKENLIVITIFANQHIIH